MCSLLNLVGIILFTKEQSIVAKKKQKTKQNKRTASGTRLDGEKITMRRKLLNGIYDYLRSSGHSVQHHTRVGRSDQAVQARTTCFRQKCSLP